MNILFIHQYFPGPFKHIAPALTARGHYVLALTINGSGIDGVTTLRYKPARSTTQNIHPWVIDFETKVIRAEACVIAAEEIRKQGFTPDVIVAHTGWGEALLLKHIWPKTKILGYLEHYYKPTGADNDFDPEHRNLGWENAGRIQLKNAANLLSLESLDWGLSPSHWQKKIYPQWMHNRISVINDGINTKIVQPNSEARIRLNATGKEISAADEILTYVSDHLEPHSGIHSFLRALPLIQQQRPNAITLIVGDEKVGYSAKSPDGRSWRDVYWAEVHSHVDASRVVFLEPLPREEVLKIIQISRCHVHLSYPFMLSPLLLEAMSVGCLVIGSNTAPVAEAIQNGQNGLLVDFFDPQAIATAVSFALSHPEPMRKLGLAARRTIEQCYDLNTICLPKQIALIEAIGNGQRPKT